MTRPLVTAALVVAVVFVGALVVWVLDGSRPSRASSSPESATPTPAAPTAAPPADIPAPTSVEGSVPAPDPRYPLAKDIPGCVCHSDDPKLVQDHAGYRMNQCFGCHDGGIPTGQK